MDVAIAAVSSNESLEQVLRDNFLRIFHNKQKYKWLLKSRGDDAQNVVNSLQMILNNSQTSLVEKRPDFLKLLLRLSKRSNCYPQCLILQGIEATGDIVAMGSFGEVRKGNFGGMCICLKVMKIYQQDMGNIQKLFAKEAILWRNLSHPNLLPFYGIHLLNDRHRSVCLVSPWMENGNAMEYLERFPRANRLFLVKDIARGLHYLHQRGIVHGDLKGANILVTSSGRACLADFGLSSMSDDNVVIWTSLKSTAKFGGTLRWQAPEIINQDSEGPVAKESDIYAFGGVCYEIFTGRVPFYETKGIGRIVLKIISGEKPSKPDLDSRNPHSAFHCGLTECTWNLMQDCWNKDPVKRPSVRVVLERLPTGAKDTTAKHDWDFHERFRTSMQRNSNRLSITEVEGVIRLLSGLEG